MESFSHLIQFKDKNGKERVLEIPFVVLTNRQEKKLIELFNKQLGKNNIKEGVWLDRDQSKEFIENKNDFFETLSNILKISTEEELINKLEKKQSIILVPHSFERYSTRKNIYNDDSIFTQKLQKAFSSKLKEYHKNENKENKDEAQKLVKIVLESDLVDKVEVNNNKVRFRVGSKWDIQRLAVEFYPDGFLNGTSKELIVVISYLPDEDKDKDKNKKGH